MIVNCTRDLCNYFFDYSHKNIFAKIIISYSIRGQHNFESIGSEDNETEK